MRTHSDVTAPINHPECCDAWRWCNPPRRVEPDRLVEYHEHLLVTDDRRFERVGGRPLPFAIRLREMNREIERSRTAAAFDVQPQRVPQTDDPAEPKRPEAPRIADLNQHEQPQIVRKVSVTYQTEAFLPRGGLLDLFI